MNLASYNAAPNFRHVEPVTVTILADGFAARTRMLPSRRAARYLRFIMRRGLRVQTRVIVPPKPRPVEVDHFAGI